MMASRWEVMKRVWVVRSGFSPERGQGAGEAVPQTSANHKFFQRLADSPKSSTDKKHQTWYCLEPERRQVHRLLVCRLRPRTDPLGCFETPPTRARCYLIY